MCAAAALLLPNYPGEDRDVDATMRTLSFSIQVNVGKVIEKRK